MPQAGGVGGNGDPPPRPGAGCSATADRPSWHASAAAANGGIGLFSRPAQQFACRQRTGHLFGGQLEQCEAGGGDLGSLTNLSGHGGPDPHLFQTTGSGATARAEGGHIPTNICCIISTPQICGTA